MIPRVRGKVGQATEPEEVKGKWYFELFLSDLGSGVDESFGHFGPFETEEIAQRELRNAARMACETIEKRMTGQVSGKYIDLKSNVTRRWDKADEH